ncbi:uncharacterized protein [Aristolochia californica]|uniref:uncharacterized protein n=1 Tax=Aristolochia californica TaxID=171875 RepID=UPI0035D8B953
MSSVRPRFVWRGQQLGMYSHQPYSFHAPFMLADDEIQLAKKMSEDAVRGQWTEIYKHYPENTKLTLNLRGQDTVLHYAVLEAETEVVKNLVEMLNDVNLRDETLLLKDEGGNTPLHLAAARGDKKMCSFLAGFNPQTLINAINFRGETPLFVAALHGKKDAFFTLYDILKEADGGQEIPNSCFRRSGDGDSILHVAIALEHFGQDLVLFSFFWKFCFNSLRLCSCKGGPSLLRFTDLAYHVIRELPHLVDIHNTEGESVQDVLASHPRPFQSCHNLELMDRIIYTFVPADPIGKRPKSERNRKVLPQRRQQEQRGRIIKLLDKMANHFGEARAFFHLMSLIFLDLVTLGIDTLRIWKIKENKTRYTWALLVLGEVFKHIAEQKDYHADGRIPDKHMPLPPSTEAFQQLVEGFQPHEEEVPESTGKGDFKLKGSGKEKPILIAAKNGIVEVVEKILHQYPQAIHDVNEEGKNAVLIAVEKGHVGVYRLLTASKYKKDSALREMDHEGNSALHLAAKRSENRPWNIPGAAMELQCEFKWFKYIEESMGANYFTCLNVYGQTPKQIFDETHQTMVSDGSKWLVTSSQAASAIGVLVATLAYTSIISVPGSYDENDKTPLLGGKHAFNVFVVANFLGLCFSMISITMYVDIFSSNHKIDDFESKLPHKFANALTFLFLSVLSIVVSFFSAFTFVIQKPLKPFIYPVSYVAVFPLVIWMVSQLQFYYRLLKINYGGTPLIVF